MNIKSKKYTQILILEKIKSIYFFDKYLYKYLHLIKFNQLLKCGNIY